MTTRWGILESPKYERAVEAWGLDRRVLDDSLLAVTWGLAHVADDAELFPELQPDVRMAKAHLIGTADLLRVFFYLEHGNAVLWDIDVLEISRLNAKYPS